jgi:hypothetical protein
MSHVRTSYVTGDTSAVKYSDQSAYMLNESAYVAVSVSQAMACFEGIVLQLIETSAGALPESGIDQSHSSRALRHTCLVA